MLGSAWEIQYFGIELFENGEKYGKNWRLQSSFWSNGSSCLRFKMCHRFCWIPCHLEGWSPKVNGQGLPQCILFARVGSHLTWSVSISLKSVRGSRHENSTRADAFVKLIFKKSIGYNSIEKNSECIKMKGTHCFSYNGHRPAFQKERNLLLLHFTVMWHSNSDELQSLHMPQPTYKDIKKGFSKPIQYFIFLCKL